MTYSTPPLIAPPKEEEIHPYRRVWRSLIREVTILTIVCAGVFVVFQFLNLPIPDQIEPILNYGLALLPLALWIIFSRLPEVRVPLPRAGLNTSVMFAALLAAALGAPIVNVVIQPASWLSLQSAPMRVIGYTLTAGIVQEFIKFLVVRYVAAPNHFRIREDSIAYNLAAAAGYMTVLNLIFVVNVPASPDYTALRILHHATINIAGSLIMSYGMAQTWFARVLPIIMPGTLALAALITGISTPLHSGFTNAALSLTVSAPRPYLSLAFSLAVLAGVILVLIFFYRVAEDQERVARQTGYDL